MPSILFIGGTGLISSECATLALEHGFEVFLLTRGKRPAIPGTTAITTDISDPASVKKVLADRTFDAVTDFISFTPEEARRDIDLFAGRCRQFLHISTCACYQKPPTDYLITEGTPLANPFWTYAQQKIAAEDVMMAAHRDRGFPVTIVRPSLTYGQTRIPAAYHNSTHSWTTAHRMLAGKPVIVHGDGSSLWQVTHAADFAKGFVGLIANPAAVGHAFHITTDEVMTWDRILLTLGDALNVKPDLIHIPTDFIARFDPARAAGLYGDKAHSVVIDNTKIKRFVPGYQAAVPFRTGLAKTVEWFRADKTRQTIDPELDAMMDKIVAAYRRGFPA